MLIPQTTQRCQACLYEEAMMPLEIIKEGQDNNEAGGEIVHFAIDVMAMCDFVVMLMCVMTDGIYSHMHTRTHLH